MEQTMATASVLGFPRIGAKRELKKAVESFWSGRIDEDQLHQTCRDLRRKNWQLQRDYGIDQIPSNDFSLYDQVLDTTALLGAVPERYDWVVSSAKPLADSVQEIVEFVQADKS